MPVAVAAVLLLFQQCQQQHLEQEVPAEEAMERQQAVLVMALMAQQIVGVAQAVEFNGTIQGLQLIAMEETGDQEL
jgi:hypothetical protein